MKNSATLPIFSIMKTLYVPLTQAKVELERLITKARKGELIFICRYGKPEAWIEPLGADYKEVGKRLRRAVRILQRQTKQG
jgi:antitoxin (DNA-binding transcriptional repressor) of toxin-antitoxin stability system